VTITVGTKPWTSKQCPEQPQVVALSRWGWTRISRTSPSPSTARHITFTVLQLRPPFHRDANDIYDKDKDPSVSAKKTHRVKLGVISWPTTQRPPARRIISSLTSRWRRVVAGCRCPANVMILGNTQHARAAR
jgi:hypothetical protein